MEAQPREIRRYTTPDGRIPFAEWRNSLRDRKAISVIDNRLRRVRLGNIGDFRSVGEGVCEFRIDYGPGYRIYFGQIGSAIVLLLCGGDKSTQAQDIGIGQTVNNPPLTLRVQWGLAQKALVDQPKCHRTLRYV